MIATKFNVGDAVWAASYDSENIREVCPDCLGERVWAATLPSGESFNIPCPTCHYGFNGSRGYITERWACVPKVVPGTVWKIRADTWRDDICYSFSENGGRIYYEPDLFLTHDEAMAQAEKKAVEQQQRMDEQRVTNMRRKRADRPGSLVAYLRREIARHKRDIAATEAHIARLQERHPRMKPEAKP